MSVRLKRIWSRCRFRIDCGAPLVSIERIRKNLGDEIFGIGVLQMDQMSGAVKSEAVLRKRAAESANLRFLFEENGIVLGKMVARADAGKAAPNNNDSLPTHERMSTLMSRYAERHAAEMAPAIVAAAHSSVTWLMSSATPLRSAPTT